MIPRCATCGSSHITVSVPTFFDGSPSEELSIIDYLEGGTCKKCGESSVVLEVDAEFAIPLLEELGERVSATFELVSCQACSSPALEINAGLRRRLCVRCSGADLESVGGLEGALRVLLGEQQPLAEKWLSDLKMPESSRLWRFWVQQLLKKQRKSLADADLGLSSSKWS